MGYIEARVLYDETRSQRQSEWSHVDPMVADQFLRLSQFVSTDRTNLGNRLFKGLNQIWEGLGKASLSGVGEGFSEIKDVARELSPRGPIT